MRSNYSHKQDNDIRDEAKQRTHEMERTQSWHIGLEGITETLAWKWKCRNQH